MNKLTVNGSWLQFVEPLRKQEAFTTHGSLRGEPVSSPTSITLGRLDPAYHSLIKSHGTKYVVYSYTTPIAWYHSVDGWTVPNEKYSVSTSKQQGRIATAISQLGKC